MAIMVDTYSQQTGGPSLRHGVAVTVVLVHLGLIASTLIPPAPPTPAATTMMVSFVAPPQAEEAPPPPAPKVEKQRPVLASKRHVEAAATAPVIPPEPVPVPEVAQEAPPSPPAPQTAPAPAAPAIVPPNVRAAYANNPSPVYPSASRRLNETGVSRLRVLVAPSGRVQQIEIERSSGFSRLDQAAMSAVRDWKFAPARQGESAVAAWVLVPINWKLEK